MRGSFAISLLLHVAAIAFAVVGVPRWWDPRVAEPTPILVELVQVADITVARQEEEPEPEPEPEKQPEPEAVVAEKVAPKPPDPPKEAPPPPPRRVEAPPPPPPPSPEPAAKPAPPAPEPVPPEPKPEVAEPKPEPKPAPQPPAPARAAVPTPMAKPTPKEPEKKFDLAEIQALLDKRRPSESHERVTEQRRSEDAAPPARRLAAAGQQMTQSEVDAIKAQISQYWSVPAGARDIESLVVKVRVFLRPDGSLERPPEIVDEAGTFIAGETYYRTAAEAALRAVRRAEPLRNLPVDKYEHWRELVITFDPKDMVRG